MVVMPSIKLDGQKYELDPNPEAEAYREMPQDVYQNPNQIGFWQSWVMRSWHGGERVTRILEATDLERHIYDDGEGCDVSTWGQLKLQPSLDHSFAANSATLVQCVSNDGTTVLVGHEARGGKYMAKFSGNPGSWVAVDTPNSATVSDIIQGAGQKLYAIQGTRIIEQTDTDGTYDTWANVTSGMVLSGTASAGNTTTITLAADGGYADDALIGYVIRTTGGTGSGQILTITDWVKSTKVATFATATSLGGDTVYEIYTAETPMNMVALTYCAGQLYALGASYLRYWDGAAWQTASEVGGSCCCTFGEQVYFAKDNRLFRWNGTAAYQVDQLTSDFNITGLFSYRNLLFITGYYLVQGGKKGSVFYMLDGRDAHLYNVGSTDGSSDYTVSAIAGGDDEIYFSNQKRGGVDRYDLTKGGMSCGPLVGTATTIPFKGMAVHNGKLLMSRYTAVTRANTCQAASATTTTSKLDASASSSNDAYNGQLIYINAGTGIRQQATISDYDGTTKIATHSAWASPVDATSEYVITNAGVYIANTAIPTAFKTSGWITTPEMDFLFPVAKKLFNTVYINHRALAASQSIKVEHSLDGGTTWVVTGYSFDVGTTEKVFAIPNVSGATIKLRITLTGPGTSTPTVTLIRVDGIPMGEPKFAWIVSLAIYGVQGGRTKIGKLRDAYRRRAVLDFEDIHGEKHPVIIDQEVMSIPFGDKWTGKVQLKLREV